MNQIFQSLVYPAGTYHFCKNGNHIAISGQEKKLTIEKSHKKAWEEQTLAETCYWAKQYFNQHMDYCDYKALYENNFKARYQNYGCFIASTNAYNFQPFLEYLNQKCDKCVEGMTEYIDAPQSFPLDTFHYCYDNTHITVKGNDDIMYREDDGHVSKKAWSNYNRDDSCKHIREYFKTKQQQSCDIMEPAIYPVRSYGSCFVATSNNITRPEVTIDMQDYLEGLCKGCKKGYYYHPEVNMNNSSTILTVNHLILFILLMIKVLLK